MKKLYSTFALALAVSLGASAQGNLSQIEFGRQESSLMTTAETSLNLVASQKHSMHKQAPAKAAGISSIDDICGAWFWYGINIFDEVPTETNTNALYAEKSIIPNTVKVFGFFDPEISVNATINVANAKASIRGGQKIGESSKYGNVTLRFYQVTQGVQSILDWPQVNTVEAEIINGTLLFPEDVFVGCYVKSGADEGFLNGWISNLMGPTDLTEWEEAGKAYFIDGYLLAAETANQYPYEVDMMVDADNPSRYKVVNPYQNSVLNLEGENLDQDALGAIVFDMSNPNCVMFDPRYYSGMKLSTYGKMYMYDLGGLLGKCYGWDATNLLNKYPAEELSTFVDDVVTVATPLVGGTQGTVSDGQGNQISVFPYIGLSFGSGDEESTSPKIVFDSAGVNDILSNDTNAPVEYFNLQGVRVANPENGLYIRRQGNKATKVLVK